MKPIEDLQNFLFVILLFTFRNDIDFKQLYFSVYTCNFSDYFLQNLLVFIILSLTIVSQNHTTDKCMIQSDLTENSLISF